MKNKIACGDCGMEYEAGAPHRMFCPAKTCTWCGTTFSDVIEIHDEDKIDEDGFPERVCEDCLLDEEEED